MRSAIVILGDVTCIVAVPVACQCVSADHAALCIHGCAAWEDEVGVGVGAFLLHMVLDPRRCGETCFCSMHEERLWADAGTWKGDNHWMTKLFGCVLVMWFV